MEYYTYILAFHVISVMSWMGMLFYLPRLFVYHQENKNNIEFIKIVKIQEYKLYKYIGVPAMWAAFISGILMIFLNVDLLKMPWLHAKLLVVTLLILYSFSLEFFRRRLASNLCQKDGRFFRAYNEVPTLLAILIVTFVILKSIPIIFSVNISVFFAFIIYIIIRGRKK
jgi:putative membrane protein